MEDVVANRRVVVVVFGFWKGCFRSGVVADNGMLCRRRCGLIEEKRIEAATAKVFMWSAEDRTVE